MTGRHQRFPGYLQRGIVALKPTLFLFTVDTFANIIDYGFHIYLGRALSPGDFAVFQTLNSALLIVITAFGVLQPVLARQVAQAQAADGGRAALTSESRALFQAYLLWGILAGLALGLLIWLLADLAGGWLKLPAYAVRSGAVVVFFVLLRPVVAGVLQGGQRFVAFGATRLAFAAGRFAFAAGVIAAGAGLAGAVASLPVGQLLAVFAGLVLLGGSALRRGDGIGAVSRIGESVRLAGYAFVAYAAFTALQNLDLLWVNQMFTPGESGAYAAAVLLRRVLILFPGAATVVMYPRIVAAVAKGGLPDRLLGWTLALVSASVSALAAVYAWFGPWIVGAAFGPGYELAGSLLGTMGAAMIGYAVVSVWLNVFLATRPALFVGLLALSAVLQGLLLSQRVATPGDAAAVFAQTGWLVAAAGAVVYFFHLRPIMKSAAGQ